MKWNSLQISKHDGYSIILTLKEVQMNELIHPQQAKKF